MHKVNFLIDFLYFSIIYRLLLLLLETVSMNCCSVRFMCVHVIRNNINNQLYSRLIHKHHYAWLHYTTLYYIDSIIQLPL